jgi:putative transposase
MFASLSATVHQARRHDDLYFAGLLKAQEIEAALGPARALFRGWLYTPAITVWTFLSQCLSPDHSCREAVARFIAWRVSRGQQACSAETGGYCLARDRLPEEGCQQLLCQTGQQLEAEAPESWWWHGRRVRVVDGSTITLPDTPENQEEYPQAHTQKPGCGFPIARIVVVFSLAVGSVVEAVMGQYKGKGTGENSLLRTLHDAFAPRDIVLGDRYFSGWFDIVLLAQRGVDVVLRKHHLRHTDFRMGRRLGPDDHVVNWQKPARPQWLDAETYAALPDALLLREVRVHVLQRGFRTQVVVVVTTLLDAHEFPKDDLASLYRQRWQAELNLRSLKSVMQMDHLRCLTPHRARNEFYIHLLAYNLIRNVMAIAAIEAGVRPYQMSFKGTLQSFTKFLEKLHAHTDVEAWCAALIHAVATHDVGNRPDRVEPRVKKRRPKPYKLMQQPRAAYKRLYA